MLQVAPPSAGGFDPGSLLSYNSQGAPSASGVYGSGWTATYNRSIRQVSSTVAQVTDNVGNVFTYTRPSSSTTRYTPPAGANNGLVATASGGWIETQPDGLAFNYPAPASNQIALVQSVQNRAGGLWTMTYDSTGTLLQSITSPSAQRTSFAYDTNGHIKSYQDGVGRITTFVVNSTGDLVQVTTPALCITSFAYANHLLTLRIDPMGFRTSFAYDGNSRVTKVMAADGTVTSFSYTAAGTALTDPRGGLWTDRKSVV